MGDDGAERGAFSRFELSGWEGAAAAYHDRWGQLTLQSVAPMLRAAGVGAGSRVLDVATGAGYLAAGAEAMGAEAVGLDFAEAQVALARATYPDVAFVQGDAQDLPFQDGAFDAVLMGFGANHLPDPARAFVEARRVLRPGGRFAFSVWVEPRPSEGFGIVMRAIEAHGDPEVDLPEAPPYFRFADRTESRRMLEAAGFVDIASDIAPQHWRHSDVDATFKAFAEGAVRATAFLRQQTEDARRAIKSAVRDEVQALWDGTHFVVPVPAIVHSGAAAG